MYNNLSNLVIGFHGCDRSVFDKVVRDGEPMIRSENSYDWLGSGFYFWENGYHRAIDWANTSPKITTSAVIGAVIDLGYCLNLTDYNSATVLRNSYDILKFRCEQSNERLPSNKRYTEDGDALLRDLDCAVINQIHRLNRRHQLPSYDSVRGIFTEGGEVYPGSGFMVKTHVQICIVNPNCIKGVFSPREFDAAYRAP